MSRKNIRLLASGFLFSGLLILVLNGINPAETAASEQETVEALEAEIRYLEEVAVSLELENEQLTAEQNLLSENSEIETTADLNNEEDETDTEQSDTTDTDEPDTADESDEENDEESDLEQNAQSDVTEYVVIVNEGEPSSVVAKQLESFALIDDYHAFNTYMEENNLFRQLRPGEYTVHSDMTRQQLIEAIIR